MPNPHNPINAFTHQSNTLYLCETHWKKKIPITTTTNTNSFLTTIIIFLNAAEWICCNWMSNFLSVKTFYIHSYSSPITTHLGSFSFLFDKAPFTKLNHFLFEQPRNTFYILLLLGMVFWKLIYIATAGVKTGKEGTKALSAWKGLTIDNLFTWHWPHKHLRWAHCYLAMSFLLLSWMKIWKMQVVETKVC